MQNNTITGNRRARRSFRAFLGTDGLFLARKGKNGKVIRNQDNRLMIGLKWKYGIILNLGYDAKF